MHWFVCLLLCNHPLPPTEVQGHLHNICVIWLTAIWFHSLNLCLSQWHLSPIFYGDLIPFSFAVHPPDLLLGRRAQCPWSDQVPVGLWPTLAALQVLLWPSRPLTLLPLHRHRQPSDPHDPVARAGHGIRHLHPGGSHLPVMRDLDLSQGADPSVQEQLRLPGPVLPTGFPHGQRPQRCLHGQLPARQILGHLQQLPIDCPPIVPFPWSLWCHPITVFPPSLPPDPQERRMLVSYRCCA